MFFRSSQKEIETALLKTIEKSAQTSYLILATFVELAEKQCRGEISKTEHEQLTNYNPFLIFDSVLNHKAGGIFYALRPAKEFSLLELEIRVYAVKLTVKGFLGYPFDSSSAELERLAKEFKVPDNTIDLLHHNLNSILERELVPESSLYMGYPKNCWELIEIVSQRIHSPSPAPPNGNVLPFPSKGAGDFSVDYST